MHLIAVVSADADTRHALHSFHDAQGRFHLHAAPPGSVDELYRALRRLDFAGALILDDAAQADALTLADRSSLDAEEVGGADTATVTPGGVIAEYNLGRAASALLEASRWDARGADVVLAGGAQAARGLARELSSQGAASVAMLAGSPADAERVLPALPVGTGVVARAASDPLVPTLLERADLVVRLDAGVRLPGEWPGPHVTLLDLVAEPVSSLRRRAMSVGALTFNRRDLDAYLIELGLTHILGAPVGVEPLLELFHTL